VSETTTNLFLEAAFFEPKVIAGRSRRLGFNSDAAHRFERGVDFGGTRRALERLTQIIVEISGGKVGPITEARAPLPKRKSVTLRLTRAQRVLGIPLTSRDVEIILTRLQLPWTLSDVGFEVTPPSHRFDLEIEEDLIEEVGRIQGYDHIPAALPQAEQLVAATSEGQVSDTELRSRLVARGYQEVITFSFVPRSWEEDFADNARPIGLENPIASHLEVMRSQMFGSLMECLLQNLNRGQERVRIFELGRCYLRDGLGYRQPLRLAGLAYGDAAPEQWGLPARFADIYDVKGDLSALLSWRVVTYVVGPHPAFHPGKSAEMRVGGQQLGWLGELHPKWMQKYELPRPTVMFEIDLDLIRESTVPKYQEYSRLPVVTRDLAIVLPETVGAGDLMGDLMDHRPVIVRDIVLFDLYRGKGIEVGKKSLAFRVLLQDTQKTLTDAEVDAAVQELLERVRRKFDGRLRD